MQGMDKILCKSHRRELLKQLFYIVVLVPCLLCICSQNAPQPRDGLLEKAGWCGQACTWGVSTHVWWMKGEVCVSPVAAAPGAQTEGLQWGQVSSWAPVGNPVYCAGHHSCARSLLEPMQRVTGCPASCCERQTSISPLRCCPGLHGGVSELLQVVAGRPAGVRLLCLIIAPI